MILPNFTLHERKRVFPKFKIWSPGGATCLVILLGIAQLASLAEIGIVSSSARVSSAKVLKMSVTDSCRQTDRNQKSWCTLGSDRNKNGNQFMTGWPDRVRGHAGQSVGQESGNKR